MGGGLMQLVAYGAQDIYLTGNPQITYFKLVYRRHTNFAIEAIEQVFTGVCDFGRKCTATISRNGDLITRIYLVVEVPAVLPTVVGDTVHWTRNLGNIMIKNVELEIGGQRIDRQYGEWMVIWSELTLQPGHVAGYAEMIGNTVDMYSPTTLAEGGLPQKTLYIPLQFFFCRNVGLALPLIALQYHEVKINVELRPLNQLLAQEDAEGNKTDVPAVQLVRGSLWVDYIYLDTDERRRFAQVSHEYLIEQVQFTGEETVTGSNEKYRMSFNHPVKELIWVGRLNLAEALCQWSNFTTGVTPGGGAPIPGQNDAPGAYAGFDPLVAGKLQLNGHDRFSERRAAYFNLVQPFQHHTNIPNTGIYVYSFALKPEEHQPSGTVNLSRIDNATFCLTFLPSLFNGTLVGPGNYGANTTVTLLMYAHNYNVLRIMSGMGGLAYSN